MTTVTSTSDLPTLTYQIEFETGVRFVYDNRTGIWGAGDTALDAIRDYEQAVIDHAEVERGHPWT